MSFSLLDQPVLHPDYPDFVDVKITHGYEGRRVRTRKACEVGVLIEETFGEGLRSARNTGRGGD